MRSLRPTLLALLVALAVAPAAHAQATLQPGDVYDYVPDVGGCTLGFAFAGAGKTYFATAAHCVWAEGDRVRDADGTEFGTVAFLGLPRGEQDIDGLIDGVTAAVE